MNTYVLRMPGKRSYTLKKRAESQEETRRRIIEATMNLHEEIGPRATTISAIADRAGVQRLTVYRHFPDETAVFQACTAHWLSLNPPPNPEDWADIADGSARARAALAAFYGYYRHTQRMWTVSFRDVAEVPALHGPMSEVGQFLRGIGEDLVRHLPAPADRQAALAATVHHALAFQTWQSLNEQGLNDEAMVELVVRWIVATIGSES
jgi:AcrR family transcriptional regulator